VEAVEISGKQCGKTLKATAAMIASQVESGCSLSDAMAPYDSVFTDFHINLIRMGEKSGSLSDNLKNLAEELKKSQELHEKIKTAMLYPTIVLALSFSLFLLMVFFVLPNLMRIFSGLDVDLPFLTRALIWFTDFTIKYKSALLISLAAIAVVLSWLFRQKFFKPVLHRMFLYLPVIGNISKFKNLADFSRTMNLLLRSGLSFFEILSIAEKTTVNYSYKKIIAEAKQSVMEGKKLSDVLSGHKREFPEMAVGMIKVGERSGKLEEEFLNLAEIYGREVTQKIEKISVIIEPVLLIFIGLGAGTLAVSIISPIYKITGKIY
jgi:type II secretory pathway component PulF